MKDKIKGVFGSKDNKRLLSNIFSLGSLQIVSYLLPLITIPYLIRVIGVEKFGLISFATAFTMYFILLSDYGFNLSATKQISDHRGDREWYSKIFCEVFTVKFILAAFSLILLSFLMIFDFFNEYAIIYFLTFGVVIGQLLFPVWFFQGMEEMKHIAIINVVSKSIFTFLIFLCVKEPEDFWMVPLLTSLGFIVGGAYAFLKAISRYEIAVSIPKRAGLLFQLKSGWHVFLSRIYVCLYTTTNIVLLGFMTSNVVVGYYAVAEKILQALSGLFAPVIQAFYPYLANVYKNTKDKFFRLFKQLNILFFVSAALLAIISFPLSDLIVTLIVGELNEDISLLFSILVFSVLTAPFGPSFTNGLLVLGEAEKVSVIVMKTMLVNIILVIPLIYYFEAAGLAFTWVVVHVFHVLLYIHEYKKIVKKNMAS